MKLQIKVLLFVIVILLATGVVSGGMMLYLQRRASVIQFEQMATALASAVQGSLEQAMMLGERQHIQEAMVRIGTEEMVSETAIVLPDGTIAASSEVARIGQTIDRDEISQALQSGVATARTNQRDSLNELQIIIPIFNKAECQTCHSQDITLLGAIQISLDTAPLENQTRQQTLFFGAFGGLTLLIIGLGLAHAIKKIILTPLSGLAETAQRLSQGDYAARMQSDKNDEIGVLSIIFNEMAEKVEQRTRDLELSQQELAKWNVDLETKVQERIKEIIVLNSKLEEMNRLREQLLGKIISTQEEERRRIARELHDEASQSLAALVLHLEDVADNLPARYRATKQRLEVLKEQAERTLGGIRNLALELRPSALDDLGLAKAIEWYAKDYLGKRGLNFKFELSGLKVKLPPYTETILFRIIQEALTNVVKHAQANQVSVKLQLSETQANVQIEDDGKGFDVDVALSRETGQKNLGLHGMIERAALLGGTFNIRSQHGLGTHLIIYIPLTAGENKYGQD